MGEVYPASLILINLDIPQLLVCSLPRYMRAYRPLLSCNNSPLFRLRGYLAYRTVGSNLVVSVAWQLVFPALGNSAFQTTWHNIICGTSLGTSVCEDNNRSFV
jgi:hypothetical protein